MAGAKGNRGRSAPRRGQARVAAWLHDRMVAREMTTASGRPNAAELARRIGVSDETVRRWLRGEKAPDAAYADRLAAEFGVRTEFVLMLSGRLPWADPDEEVEDPLLSEVEQRVQSVRWTPERAETVMGLMDLWRRADRRARQGDPPEPDPPPRPEPDPPRTPARQGSYRNGAG